MFHYFAVDEDITRGIRYEFEDSYLLAGFYFIYPDEGWIR